MSNLKPLVWTDNQALGAIHSYKIKNIQSKDGVKLAVGGKFHVEKIRLQTQKKETVTGFSSIEQAKNWAFSHYCMKMKPYVKPSPTWIDASKQLPQVDKDTQFICAYDSALEPFSKVAWFNEGIGDFGLDHDDVLAWMPIPEFSTMQILHKGE